MRHLGYERFAIIGHDRGSYTAFRTAMDHPEAVKVIEVSDTALPSAWRARVRERRFRLPLRCSNCRSSRRRPSCRR
jgi:pimeloyl-ACP methyl ester carboxylesterase